MSQTPERLPSRPLRNWFLAWHIHTGDSPEVIAKGFDLDVELVADLVSGDTPLMVDTQVAIHACRAIRVAPSAFWPSISSWPTDGSSDFDCAWSEIPARLVAVLAG